MRTTGRGLWSGPDGCGPIRINGALVIRAERIYIEVDDLDAALWLGMAGTGSPGPIVELSSADLL